MEMEEAGGTLPDRVQIGPPELQMELTWLKEELEVLQ